MNQLPLLHRCIYVHPYLLLHIFSQHIIPSEVVFLTLEVYFCTLGECVIKIRNLGARVVWFFGGKQVPLGGLAMMGLLVGIFFTQGSASCFCPRAS